jgi:hypothetical protein
MTPPFAVQGIGALKDMGTFGLYWMGGKIANTLFGIFDRIGAVPVDPQSGRVLSYHLQYHSFDYSKDSGKLELVGEWEEWTKEGRPFKWMTFSQMRDLKVANKYNAELVSMNRLGDIWRSIARPDPSMWGDLSWKEVTEIQKKSIGTTIAPGTRMGAWGIRTAQDDAHKKEADILMARAMLSRRDAEAIGEQINRDPSSVTPERAMWAADQLVMAQADLRKSIDAEIKGAFWGDPYYFYTGAIDYEKKEKFLNAVADLTLQAGRKLTPYEIEDIKQRFIDIAYELPGELVFDYQWFVPGLNEVFNVPFKAVGATAKIVGHGVDAVTARLLGFKLVDFLGKKAESSIIRKMAHVTEDTIQRVASAATKVGEGAEGEVTLKTILANLGVVASTPTGTIGREQLDAARALGELGTIGPREIENAKLMLEAIPLSQWEGKIDQVKDAVEAGWTKTFREKFLNDQKMRDQVLQDLTRTGRITADMTREELDALVEQGITTLAEIAAKEKVAKPINLANALGEEFRKEYAKRRFERTKLKFDVSFPEMFMTRFGLFEKYPKFRVTFDTAMGLWQKVFGWWATANLTMRPAWNVINLLDTQMRYLLAAPGGLANLGDLLRTYLVKNELIDKALRDAGFVLPLELTEQFAQAGVPLGSSIIERILGDTEYRPTLLGSPMSFLREEYRRMYPTKLGRQSFMEGARRSGRDFIESVRRNGFLPVIVQRSGKAIDRTAGDAIRLWARVGRDYANLLEISFRMNMFHQVFTRNFVGLDTAAKLAVIRNLRASGATDDAIDFFGRAWSASQYNPDQLGEILTEMVEGRSKGRGYEMSKVVPPNLERMPIDPASRELLATEIRDRLLEFQHVMMERGEPLTPLAYRRFFDDMIGKTREATVSRGRAMNQGIRTVSSEALPGDRQITGFRIGISSVNGAETVLFDGIMKRANELAAAGDIEGAMRLRARAVGHGTDYLRNVFPDLLDLEVQPTIGVFDLTQREPSIRFSATVHESQIDEITYRASIVARDEFKQKQVILHWVDDTPGLNYGIVNEAMGESIEPSLTLRFDHALSQAEEDKLYQIAIREGKVFGFEMHPDRMGVDFIHLSIYDVNYKEYAHDLHRITGDLESEAIPCRATVTTRRVRTVGYTRSAAGAGEGGLVSYEDIIRNFESSPEGRAFLSEVEQHHPRIIYGEPATARPARATNLDVPESILDPDELAERRRFLEDRAWIGHEDVREAYETRIRAIAANAESLPNKKEIVDKYAATVRQASRLRRSSMSWVIEGIPIGPRSGSFIDATGEVVRRGNPRAWEELVFPFEKKIDLIDARLSQEIADKLVRGEKFLLTDEDYLRRFGIDLSYYTKGPKAGDIRKIVFEHPVTHERFVYETQQQIDNFRALFYGENIPPHLRAQAAFQEPWTNRLSGWATVPTGTSPADVARGARAEGIWDMKLGNGVKDRNLYQEVAIIGRDTEGRLRIMVKDLATGKRSIMLYDDLVHVPSAIKGIDDFRTALAAVGRLDDEAEQWLTLTDAYADRWAQRYGHTKQEFYENWIAGVTNSAPSNSARWYQATANLTKIKQDFIDAMTELQTELRLHFGIEESNKITERIVNGEVIEGLPEGVSIAARKVQETNKALKDGLLELRGIVPPSHQMRLNGNPSWYCRSEKLIGDGKIVDGMSAGKVRAALSSAGVTKEELKALGLDEYLKQNERVSAGEMLELIRGNRPAIYRLERGEAAKRIVYDMANLREAGYELTEAQKLRLDQVTLSDLKWKQYALEGGANYQEFLYVYGGTEDILKTAMYREIREQLPHMSDRDIGNLWREIFDNIAEPNDNLFGESLAAISERYGEDIIAARSIIDRIGWDARGFIQKLNRRIPFSTSHWGISDVLFHFRLQDFISDTGKKILNVEELQSDMFQAARTHGFMSPEAITDMRKFVDSSAAEQKLSYATSEIRREFEDIIGTGSDLRRYVAARASIRRASDLPIYDRMYAKEVIRRFDRELADRATRYAGRVSSERLELFAYALSELDPMADAYVDLWLKKQTLLRAVAPTPFLSSWDKMAVRDILSYALENGYDGISWTRGIDQARRYALPPTHWSVHWTAQGTFIEMSRNRIPISIEDLPNFFHEWIGNSKATDEILQAIERGAVDGDLSRGARLVQEKGMETFYGEKMPAYVRDLVKQYGLDPGDMKLVYMADTGRTMTHPVTGFLFNGELRSGAQKVNPMFQLHQDIVQGAASMLDAGKMLIHLTNPDASTLGHEMSHIFHQSLIHEATINPLAKRDLEIFERWAGVVGGEWTGEAREKFARGFEVFMREGIPPTPELLSVFQRIRSFLRDIYKTIMRGGALDVDLTDQVRRAYGRMFADIPEEADTLLRRQDRIASRMFEQGVELHPTNPMLKLSLNQGPEVPIDAVKLDDRWYVPLTPDDMEIVHTIEAELDYEATVTSANQRLWDAISEPVTKLQDPRMRRATLDEIEAMRQEVMAMSEGAEPEWFRALPNSRSKREDVLNALVLIEKGELPPGMRKPPAQIVSRVRGALSDGIYSGTNVGTLPFRSPSPEIMRMMGFPEDLIAQADEEFYSRYGIHQAELLDVVVEREIREQQAAAWTAFSRNPATYRGRSLVDEWGEVANDRATFMAFIEDTIRMLRQGPWGEREASPLIDAMQALKREAESFMGVVNADLARRTPANIRDAIAELRVLHPTFVPEWDLPEGLTQWFRSGQAITARGQQAEAMMTNWRDWIMGQSEAGDVFVKGLPIDQANILKNQIQSIVQSKYDVMDASIYGSAEKAIKGALPETNHAMLDYSDYNNFDAIMRKVIPFWMFPSRSIPFWIEQTLAHPTIFAMYYKYIQNSQRLAIKHGFVDSDGLPLSSLEGCYPLGDTGIWFNPIAPWSGRYIFPRVSRKYDDVDEELPVIAKVYAYLQEYGQYWGVSVGPWVSIALQIAGGDDVTNQYSAFALFSELELIPKWWRDSLLEKLNLLDNPVIRSNVSPEVPWRDYLIERYMLTDILDKLQNGGLTEPEKIALVSQAESAIGTTDRESVPIWQTYKRNFELQEYYTKTVGFFTGFYGRRFSDADAEMLRLRSELNMLRDNINSFVGAKVMGLEGDPEQLYKNYTDQRYGTPEGLIYNLYNSIRFVKVPETEKSAQGIQRRDLLAVSIESDLQTRARYDLLATDQYIRDQKLHELPIGTDSPLKKKTWEDYFAWRIEADKMFPMARTEWMIGYKPISGITGHYRDNWLRIIWETRPGWKRDEGESYTDYQVRFQQWIKELPMLADSLRSNFQNQMEIDIREGMAFRLEGGEAPTIDIPTFVANLLKETTIEVIDKWRDETATLYTAMDRVYARNYYDTYWDAIKDKSGKELELAKELWKKSHPEPTPSQIAQWVSEQFPGRWTPGEISTAAEGRGVESVDERLAPKTQADKELESIYTVYGWAAPGTQRSAMMEENRKLGGDDGDFDILLGAGGAWSDPKDRSAFLARMLKIAVTLKLRAPSLQELQLQVTAEALNKQFRSNVDRDLGPGFWAEYVYYISLSSFEKRKYKRTHPRIQKYYDMRDAWAAGNPIWKAYYVATSASTGYSTGGGGGRGRGGGTSGGGGTAAAATPFLPMGRRSTMNAMELAATPSKVGSKRPLNALPPELIQSIPQEILTHITEEVPLTAYELEYLSRLAQLHPEWSGALQQFTGS